MGNESARPQVSVVTASFNALAGLRQTVASVQEQDFTSFEHIVIDGGSADGSVDYLRSLGDRVRWISEPDKGIADALNKGVAMAKGDYVFVLQAEDRFVSAGSLARAAECLDGTDLVSFDVAVERDGKLLPYRSHGFGEKLEWFAAIPHQGVFVTRRVFQRIGDFDTAIKVGMDYEFLLRAKRAGAICRVVPETLTYMPATGISARLDWPSLSFRLKENRLIQARHAHTRPRKLAQALFWPPYRIYKRLRHIGS
jgi:glycosyltransferase involved in cell wall biosynthesis